jgi:hypothetical protein
MPLTKEQKNKRISDRKSYLKHRDERLEKSKIYREKNKEKIALGKKLWVKKNKEHVLNKCKKYYHERKNDPEFKQKRKKYREEHKECKSIKDREYRLKNKDILRVKKRIALRKARENLADYYVRNLIVDNRNYSIRRKISSKDIPKELVELYKENIKLRRAIKKKEVNNVKQ